MPGLKTTRVLEAGVIAKYARRPDGAAARRLGRTTTEFIKKYPAETKKYIVAYARAASSSCAVSPTRRAST